MDWLSGDFKTEGFPPEEAAGGPELGLADMIAAELCGYDGCMGIYLNDLRGHVLKLHECEEFETASCCKMFVLSALFDKVEKDEASLSELLPFEERFAINGSGVLSSLELGTELSVLNLATLMIIMSDNIATNILIDYVGLDYINDFIHGIGLRGSMLHNPIDFVKYERLGTVTPSDYGLIWTRLAAGELVSRKASEEMIRICRMQHYNTMLTGKLPWYFMDEDNYGQKEHQIIWTASKSASMDECRNDGGIVHTPYGEYVIVLLNKDFSDLSYHTDHPAYTYGQAVSRLVFDWYIARKGSF